MTEVNAAEERVRAVLVRWGFSDLFNDGDQAAKLITEIVEAVDDVDRAV